MVSASRLIVLLFLLLNRRLFTVTKDADFIQLEKRFNETSKVADMLRAEGQLFRDKVSGKVE